MNNPNIPGTQQVKPADGELLLWACDQRDPRTLGPGLLNDARNLRYTDGLPETRKGVVKPAWANYTAIGSVKISTLGTPYGRGVFRDPNGVEWQIVAAGGQVWRTRPGNANVTVPLPAGIRIVSTCNFVQAFNLLFLFRGRYLAPLVLADLDTGFLDILPQYNPANAYNAEVVASGQDADEIAYGPYVTVASLTWAAGVATLATVLPHGYVTGSDVTVRGAVQIAFNGRVGITVLDDYTFTYPLSSAPAGTATGTIQVSNNIFYWQAQGATATVTNLVQQTNAALTGVGLTSAAVFSITSLTSPITFSVSLTNNGFTLATATNPNHGLVSGQSVTITGASHGNYNGTYTVTVTSANTFTYGMAGHPSGPDTGNCALAYSTLATAVAASHGLTTGATVTIAGATPSAYNGMVTVTVINASTFQYTLGSNPGGSATGTLTGTPATNLTATATKPGHGLTTGTTVTISGASPSGYNGTYVITVISTSQFTYTLAAGVTSPATGAITVTVFTGTGGGTSYGAVATAANHGFATNDTVTISGAVPLVYDGTFVINVLDANTFTYALPSNPGSNGTGVVTAQTSRVFAGQTPDTNPTAWTQVFNVLPNADTALFTDDLLLVPTAYQPSSVDNYATINGGEYSTVDFIVATNFEDFIHFEFSNELRINQGDAGEIVDLFNFGGTEQNPVAVVVILKTKSWYALGNLSAGVAGVTLATGSKQYGCSGPRAWTVVGSNAYFMSPRYGIIVIRQTDLGMMLSVNVPLSAPVANTLAAVDWLQAGRIRMTTWDNKLYVSAPHRLLGPVILVYDFVASVRMGNNVWESGVMTQGWTPLDTGSALDVLEFWELTLFGEPRHFFLDTAGYVNLLEESINGDQVPDAAGPQGLGWQEIDSYALTRSYGNSLEGQPRPVEECFSLETWDPCYSVSIVYAGANNSLPVVTNVTRSNTTYDRPFDAAPWDPTNTNEDWDTPYRQDYHINLGANLVPAGAVYPFAGVYNLIVPVGETYRYLPGANETELDYTSASGGQSVTSAATIVPTLSRLKIFGTTGELVTAEVVPGLYLGEAGMATDTFQESLDTRRLPRRQSKSYQLEFENTQGRIRLVGERISQVNTRKVQGSVT